ncbi:ribbon-helix-helix domain-containing protein [Halovivax cerinus]|uniref:Ribbon-helix-helix domain-containing protein n=1 Tax=Halovivax cerinus TaxID=1487865 RepID=A0ABD5NPV4_9EURY|nr:ribbon-helix-helix domain-containing protein [Halovivax cerinus]
MSADRKSIPVSIPDGLVEELDKLVAEGKFGSRSDALRYGARLVARESRLKRLHEETAHRAKQDVEDRLERKRVR